MKSLSEGIFHIEQITRHIQQLTKAMEASDYPSIGLSLQSISIAARIADAQFAPAVPLIELSWKSWLASLVFLDKCVDGVLAGDYSYVSFANRLLALSNEEYLHLVELVEAEDRHP